MGFIEKEIHSRFKHTVCHDKQITSKHPYLDKVWIWLIYWIKTHVEKRGPASPTFSTAMHYEERATGELKSRRSGQKSESGKETQSRAWRSCREMVFKIYLRFISLHFIWLAKAVLPQHSSSGVVIIGLHSSSILLGAYSHTNAFWIPLLDERSRWLL